MANQITYKGVLVINGKQVEDTFNGLKRAANQLERDLKKLPVGSEEFIKKTEELKIVQSRFQSVNLEIRNTRQSIQETTPQIKSFADIWTHLADRVVQGSDVSGKSINGLKVGVTSFAAQSWAAISSIPILGWVTALVAAMGIGVSKILEYNVNLQEANKLTSQITKQQGEALDYLTIRSQAFKKFFDFDEQESLEAARALVEKWKISYSEAFDLIEEGALRGGKANNEYLQSIKEYPTFFKQAGFSAQDFINIIQKGADDSVFSDKLPDAIKEFDLSIREQTTSTKDALVNAFGAQFSEDLLKRVDSGKITTKQALIEITQESEKYNLSQKQTAQLTADVFRGAGEDAGGFIEVVRMINESLEDQQEPLDEVNQRIKDQSDLYLEMELAKNDALKSDSLLAFKKEMEIFWLRLQTGFYNFISWIKDTDREINASALYVRGALLSIPEAGKVAFRTLGDILKETLSGFKSGAKSIGYFFTGQFTKAEEEADKFLATLPSMHAKLSNLASNSLKNLHNYGVKMANDFRSEYNKQTATNASIYRQDQQSGNKPSNSFDGTAGSNSSASKKAAQESEKLKRLNDQQNKDALSSAEKSAEELLKITQKYLSDKNALIEDDFTRELQEEVTKRTNQVASAKAENESILKEIKELEKKKAEATTKEAKDNYQKSIDAKKEVLKVGDEIELINQETHLKKIRAIHTKHDAELFQKYVDSEQRRIEEARRLREEEILSITNIEEAKELLKNNEHLKLTDLELRNIRTLEDAKAALREAANREMLASQLKALENQRTILEKAISGLTGEAAEKLKTDLATLNAQITSIKGAIQSGTDSDNKSAEEEGRSAMDQVDLLGFSATQWVEMFDNLDSTEGKLKGVGMAFAALSNAGQMYSQLIQAQNERELRQFTKIQEGKKTLLLKSLHDGYLTREEYTKATEKLEAEAANKKAEMEYKQAQADKIARMFGAIGATAQAVAVALTAGPIAGPILAGIVGALGAVQVGIIAAQPLPEKPSFADGGFTGNGFGMPDETGHRPAGVVHAKEWVAPQWMTEHPRYAQVIDYLESVRVGKTTNYADGGSVGDNTTTNNAPLINQSDPQLVFVLTQISTLLEEIHEEGIEAIVGENTQNAKKIARMIKQWNELESKNKH